MKVTIYTIKDCAFSKQEKEYLNANKLTFEEKDLETNKDFLTEMLAISNNFAGTPVTRVEKDDGTIAVLKGFTKEEFDKTFGLVTTPGSEIPAPTTDSNVSNESTISAPVVNDTPIPPATEVPPTVEAVPQAVEPVTPAPDPSPQPQAPSPSFPSPDPLKSVMDDLQSKSQTAEPVAPPVVETPVTEPSPPIPPATVPTDLTVTPVTLPNVPEPDFK